MNTTLEVLYISFRIAGWLLLLLIATWAIWEVAFLFAARIGSKKQAALFNQNADINSYSLDELKAINYWLNLAVVYDPKPNMFTLMKWKMAIMKAITLIEEKNATRTNSEDNSEISPSL